MKHKWQILFFASLMTFLSPLGFAQQGPIDSVPVLDVANLAFSEDSQKLVFNAKSLNRGHVAQVYDMNTKEVTFSFEHHSDFIRDIDISPDGQWVATGGMGSEAFVWNINTGEVKCAMTMPLNPGNSEYAPVNGISGVDFSDDGKYLLTSTDTQAGTWLWDVESCNPNVKVGFRISSEQPLEIFPDNNKLLIGEVVYSVLENKVISGVPVFTVQISSSNTIRYLLGMDTKFQVVELNVETQEKTEFPIIPVTPIDVALSPDGKFVSIGNINNELGKTNVFNVETGESVRLFNGSLSTKINSLVFGRSMKHFAAIHEDRVQIFDIGDLTSQIPDAAVLDNQ